MGIGLRMPLPQVLRQTVVVVVCRGLLHHLLDVPALHYVVAGAGGGVRRARVTSRGRTLQPARRRTLDPACPLRGAARPEDREPLRNRNVPAERHTRAATEVPGVPQVSKGWSFTVGDESSSALGRRPQTEATPPGASHHEFSLGMFPRKVTTAGSSTGRSYEPPPKRADTAARNPDASASTPPSTGPGARAAPLVAPHRGPLDRPAGEATIGGLWSLGDATGLARPLLSNREEVRPQPRRSRRPRFLLNLT